ncbi:metal ABC transporter ATP-binding protein [Aerococcaceae bacterium WGS1372]
MKSIITVKNLNVNYQQTTALEHVNLLVPDNVRLAIVGPNGAGKSTLIKSILNLIPAQSEEITFFNGSSLKEARSKIAYVPQTSEVNWHFPTTVEDVVMMGISSKRWGFQRISKDQKEIVAQALEAMQLTDLSHRQISQLSGGQKQRVFIARAIVQDAQLYFFDEPLAGVDMKSEAIIMDQLKLFQDRGKTSLTVHHDLNTVEKYFDHVLFMNKTKIAQGPIEEAYTKENIDKTYLNQPQASMNSRDNFLRTTMLKAGEENV